MSFFRRRWSVIGAAAAMLVYSGALRAQTVAALVQLGTGTQSSAIGLNPATNLIYIANSAINSVSVINGSTNTLVANVPTGLQPRAIAVNPVTNTIYVACYADHAAAGSVTVINGATNTTTSLATAGDPWCVAVNPVTNKVYVGVYGFNGSADNVTVMDGAAATPTAIATITAVDGPYAIAVNPVTNKAYVANAQSLTSNGALTIIDGANNYAVSTMATPNVPSLDAVAVDTATNQIYLAGGTLTIAGGYLLQVDGASASIVTSLLAGTGPHAIVVNPITNKVFVSIGGGILGGWPAIIGVQIYQVFAYNGGTATAAATSAAAITVGSSDAGGNVTGTVPYAMTVDPVTNKVWVANWNSALSLTMIDGATYAPTSVPSQGNGSQTSIVVNPVTHKIYTANYGGNATVIDGKQYPAATIPVGANPQAIVVNPVTNKAYVANYGDGTVTVIDGATNATTTVTVGPNPDAIALNPVTNKIYVANYANGSITAIDGATNNTVTFATRALPTTIRVNPLTNQIYVINVGETFSPGGVTIYDGNTNNLITTLLVTPYDIAVNTTTNRVYLSMNESVLVLDGNTHATIATVPTTSQGTIAVNPVTNRIYALNETAESGQLTVIDGGSNTVITNVTTAFDPCNLVVDSARNVIWIVDQGSGEGGSYVTIVNGATNVASNVNDAYIFPNNLTLDPVANKVYVGNSGSGAPGTGTNIAVIDGASHAISYVATGIDPVSIAVNPLTGIAYVAGYVSNSVTAIGTHQPVPLTTAIAPLSGNATANPAPTFTFNATSQFSPIAPAPQNVFYQMDGIGGTWTLAASGGVGSFSGATATLTPGLHVLYAYADDGDGATSTELEAPLVGQISAYPFVVLSPVTHLSIIAPTTANLGSPITATVEALDAANNPATGYTGTIALTTTDPTATIAPATVSFPGAGGAFAVTFNTAGTYQLTATDQNTPSLTYTFPSVVAAPIPALVFLNFLSTPYIGVSQSPTASTSPYGLPVTYTYNGSPTAPTAAGEYTVVAKIADPQYSGSASNLMIIYPATPVLNWATPAPIPFGAPLTATQLNATSSVPGTFVYTPAAGTVLGAGLQSLSATFTPTDSVDYLVGGSVSTNLLVNAPTSPPAITSPPEASGTEGAALNYDIVATNGADSYAITTGTLPTGLTLATDSGVISGIPTEAGEYAVTLQATNPAGSGSEVLSLLIAESPSAPSITSPTSATGTVGAGFVYDTTVSNVASSFAATGLPAGLTIDSGTGIISGTATTPGTYDVEITASNGADAGPPGLVIIQVNPPANTPVITSGAILQGYTFLSAVSYQITATNSPTGYAITSGTLPTGLVFDPVGGTISGTASEPASNTVWIAATNTNGQGPSLGLVLDIENSFAPVITSNGAANGQVGEPFDYFITASNGNSYGASGLPLGLTVDSNSGEITGTPATATATPLTVTMTASNGAGSASAPLLLSIAPAPGTPVVTSADAANGQAGAAFSYQILATGLPTAYAASGLPLGLALNTGTGAISGAPTQSGVFPVSVQASNGSGLGAAASVVFTIGAAATAPAITSSATATGTVGTTFSYRIAAAPGVITAYGCTGTLPPGLNFDPVGGTISGDPATAGSYTVTLTATSAEGTSFPQSLLITIAGGAGVPVVTSGNIATGTVGDDFSFVVSATNMPSTPFPPEATLDVVGLPAGLAVNPATGAITGNPDVSGTFNATVIGVNAAGTGPTSALTIVIAPSPSAPAITSSPAAAAQVGALFSYQIAGTNFPTSYGALNLPLWASVDTIGGVISGTPTAPGSFSVPLTATNSNGTSSPVTLTITVAPAANTPVVVSGLSASGQVNAAFSYQIVASGAPTSYLATGLPPGVALNSATGAITGTPTSSGTYPVAISGVNGNGAGAAATLTVVVQPSVAMGP